MFAARKGEGGPPPPPDAPCLKTLTHFIGSAILSDDFESWVESYTSDDITNLWGVDLCVPTVPEVKKFEHFLGLWNE